MHGLQVYRRVEGPTAAYFVVRFVLRSLCLCSESNRRYPLEEWLWWFRPSTRGCGF